MMFSIAPKVFYPTALLSLLFVVIVILVGEPASLFFSSFQGWMAQKLGWMLAILINVYFIGILFFAFSKIGKIKLGGPKAVPEFSTFSWVAMLFSAGMGIGLLYFSVAEPMFHFNNPINTQFSLNQKIEYSMQSTFFHYGFHVWGIYSVVGLSLAYFCFNKNKPLSLGSTIEDSLPSKLKFGSAIVDSLASLATLFGLATSLGFGASQFAAGLEELFGISNTTTTQVSVIVIITAIATVSIVSGLKNGVRLLSNLNIIIAIILFSLVLFLGPTVKLLNFFIQSTGSYLQNFIGISFERGVFDDSSKFFKGWTIFYWSWWISWSPFVGTFIARISKGRTIREFVFFVLVVPSLTTFLWMGVFGGLAFDLQVMRGIDLASIVNEDSSKALFVMLRELPYSSFISFLSVMLVATFFITSSDSGSLVVDYMTSGGKLDAPYMQKVFWACVEGLIAIALIIGGGLSALQAASLSTGFLFAIFLIFMMISFYKVVSKEI